LALNAAKMKADFLSGGFIESTERFVEQQNLWFRRQSPGEGHLLAFAATEAKDSAAEQVSNPQDLGSLSSFVPDVFSPPVSRTHTKGNIPFDG
jgi:hypothetical protein